MKINNKRSESKSFLYLVSINLIVRNVFIVCFPICGSFVVTLPVQRCHYDQRRYQYGSSSCRMSLPRGGPSNTSRSPKRNDQDYEQDRYGTQSSRKHSTNNRNLQRDPMMKEKRTIRKLQTQTELHNLLQDMGLKPVQPEKRHQQETIMTQNMEKKHGHRKIDTSEPTETLQDQLQSLYQPSVDIQLQYARNGHAVLRSVLPTQTLYQVKQDLIHFSQNQILTAYRQKVEVATQSATIASSCQSIDDCIHVLLQREQDMQRQHNDPTSKQKRHMELQLPFLQFFNTWKSISSVKNLVTSPQLASLAATLLDVPSVKLYQDSLFQKRSTDGPTPWHSDARMMPFDTSNIITFWIPLQYIPPPKQGGTGLFFTDKSHSDFALPFWNQLDDEEYNRLEDRYGGQKQNSIQHHMPLDLGDCTVHAGWTLHCTQIPGKYSKYFIPTHDKNNTNNNNMTTKSIQEQEQEQEPDRYALAVTYVDSRAQIRDNAWKELAVESSKSSYSNRGHNEDRWSFQDWLRDVKPRRYFEHELVPIVWPTAKFQLDPDVDL